MSARALVGLAALLAVLGWQTGARAGTCGNGTCEVGENAGTCPDDCLCHNTASADYALCCCCANDPNPQGQCTIKALCMFAEIGGCCCAQIDPIDPTSCLDCVPNEQLNGWCSGGIGAHESMNGSCGPGVSPVCGDTELTDDYIAGVNARTRCAATSLPLGVVEGGAEGFDLDVAVVYNEGRLPPAELAAGFPNASTGPYGKGGWLSVDEIFTDEGVYWKNPGPPAAMGVLTGSRSDRNGNGYVGYTLHTPFGSRTYDYPLVVSLYGHAGPVGVYRSEPFDGQLLLVEEPVGNTFKLGRTYTLFRYPNGPFRIYDWSLTNLPAAKPWDPSDPVRTSSLLREVRSNFGPPTKGIEYSRSIKMLRGGPSGNAPRAVLGPPFTRLDLTLEYLQQADGGMILRGSQLSQKLVYTLGMTAAGGFRPATYTSPGRKGDDLTRLTWDDWRVKTLDLLIQDQASAMLYESKATFERAADNLKIAATVQSDGFPGIPEGDETIRFEGCDVTGAVFSGTTVSMPHNVRLMFEYGDDAAQHRLLAQTHPTGARTQYAFNDQQTEPRGEMIEAVNVAGPTAPADLAKGYGTHVEWDMIEQSPLDPKLFPNDTFVGAPASRGIPVAKQLVRRPDGLVLRSASDYDVSVFLPRQVADERGMNDVVTYYPDTAQLKTHKRAGVEQDYLRSIEKIWFTGMGELQVQTIETVLVGAAGNQTSFGKLSWNMVDGRMAREIKYGFQLDPKAPTSGVATRITLEKLIVRDHLDGTPLKVQTSIDGTLVAETNLTWDPRLLGPTSSASTLNGNDQVAVKPMGGKVDGLGGPVGNWQVSGPGEKLAMFGDLDPLGNMQGASANGVGGKVAYSAGPGKATLKTSVTRLSPKGAQPEVDELETAGTTDAVCK